MEFYFDCHSSISLWFLYLESTLLTETLCLAVFTILADTPTPNLVSDDLIPILVSLLLSYLVLLFPVVVSTATPGQPFNGTGRKCRVSFDLFHNVLAERWFCLCQALLESHHFEKIRIFVAMKLVTHSVPFVRLMVFDHPQLSHCETNFSRNMTEPGLYYYRILFLFLKNLNWLLLSTSILVIDCFWFCFSCYVARLRSSFKPSAVSTSFGVVVLLWYCHTIILANCTLRLPCHLVHVVGIAWALRRCLHSKGSVPKKLRNETFSIHVLKHLTLTCTPDA